MLQVSLCYLIVTILMVLSFTHSQMTSVHRTLWVFPHSQTGGAHHCTLAVKTQYTELVMNANLIMNANLGPSHDSDSWFGMECVFKKCL